MSVLLINIILELEDNALLDMSAQREAVHPIHVTLDIMQLCQEWPLVTCVQQVRGVTITRCCCCCDYHHCAITNTILIFSLLYIIHILKLLHQFSDMVITKRVVIT